MLSTILFTLWLASFLYWAYILFTRHYSSDNAIIIILILGLLQQLTH